MYTKDVINQNEMNATTLYIAGHLSWVLNFSEA